MNKPFDLASLSLDDVIVEAFKYGYGRERSVLLIYSENEPCLIPRLFERINDELKLCLKYSVVMAGKENGECYSNEQYVLDCRALAPDNPINPPEEYVRNIIERVRKLGGQTR